jgi:UDP-galactopyranose mutase
MTNQSNDLICFSHLRWGFVFQRPQHLISRFARHGRVYFFEEPIFEGSQSQLRHTPCHRTGVHVLTPVLPLGTNRELAVEIQKYLLTNLLEREAIDNYIAWYYTPMAMEFTSGLTPDLTVYDCMDELSVFVGAPPRMLANENTLFQRADLVFTGGISLFESKRTRHASVYAFPSSVDVAHFAKARTIRTEPEDQRLLPRPRLGYAGVIDERIDTNLIEHIAKSHPNWHIVMVGPIVKIPPETLPRRSNIHYLGMKNYDDLPAYLSDWNVALLPFAQNESTRFISPTKTPEYLAAGLPVVSTPIRDVIRPYGERELVRIAHTAQEFVRAVEEQLLLGVSAIWQSEVDQYLSNLSWGKTWREMRLLMDQQLILKTGALLGERVGAAHV